MLLRSSCFDYATSASTGLELGRRGGARNPLSFYKNQRSQSDRKQDQLQYQVMTWGGRAQAATGPFQVAQRQAAQANFMLANRALDLEREAHRSCQEIVSAYTCNRRALTQGRNAIVSQEELDFLEERYSIDRLAADTAASELPSLF